MDVQGYIRTEMVVVGGEEGCLIICGIDGDWGVFIGELEG